MEPATETPTQSRAAPPKPKLGSESDAKALRRFVRRFGIEMAVDQRSPRRWRHAVHIVTGLPFVAGISGDAGGTRRGRHRWTPKQAIRRNKHFEAIAAEQRRQEQVTANRERIAELRKRGEPLPGQSGTRRGC